MDGRRPAGGAMSDATTAEFGVKSMPGVTTMLLVPEAMVATPAHWSSLTRPTARMA